MPGRRSAKTADDGAPVAFVAPDVTVPVVVDEPEVLTGLAALEAQIRLAPPSFWPEMIDAEIWRQRKEVDGISWERLEQVEDRLNQFCRALAAERGTI